MSRTDGRVTGSAGGDPRTSRVTSDQIPSSALSPTFTEGHGWRVCLTRNAPGARTPGGRNASRGPCPNLQPAQHLGPVALPRHRARLCLTRRCLLGPRMGLARRKFPERVAAAGLEAAPLNPGGPTGRPESVPSPSHLADVGTEAGDAVSCPGWEVILTQMAADTRDPSPSL